MSPGRIAAITLVAIIGVGGLASMVRKMRSTPSVPESALMPMEQVLPPLSAWSESEKKAAEVLAEAVCRGINENDAPGLMKVQDIDTFVERASAGFNFSRNSLEIMKRSAGESVRARPGGLFADAMGGKARYLRLINIRQQGSALIRVIGSDGSFNVFYLLPRFQNDRARIIEMYSPFVGAFLSEMMRDVMIPMVAAGNAGAGEDRKLMNAMEAVAKAKTSGNTALLQKTLEALPPDVRKRSAMRALYLQCLASQPGSGAYQKELERIEKEEPDTPATAMKLLDLHILRKDWAKAAEAGQKLDRFLEGDAYVKSLTAIQLAYAGKTDEAETLFAAAEAMEPDLFHVTEFRIHLDCARKDFAGAVQTLNRIKAAGMVLDPQALVETYPGVEAFVQSEEYKAWKDAQ